ncbi:MAG: PsiF family protein [Steroidobacteraceae bacterium]
MKLKSALIIACMGIGMSVITVNVHGANSQQNRMTTCNADAKTKALAGDARKTFMKGCLSGDTGESASTTATTQQEKMKTCNADAGKQALKGDGRKQFMSNCLKAK